MDRGNVVVLLEGHEEIEEEGITYLQNKGYKVLFANDKQEIMNNTIYSSSEALLVRGAKVDKKLIENMSKLKVIARGGVGTDNIDIKAATEHDVYVCNVPYANYTSVAEHVIALILALSHQIKNGDRALRKGDFSARHTYVGQEVSGKTIGVIGFGKIGQLVAEKCMYGLGMNVIAYDPYVKEVKQKGVELIENVELIYEQADFITLHLPYNSLLHHIIDGSILKKMKKSTYLINCARGGLIDEIALAEAIKNKEIAGAGIDVFEIEPPAKDHILWGLENVIVTPHMGASTQDALVRMAVGAAKEIARVLGGEEPKNAQNQIK